LQARTRRPKLDMVLTRATPRTDLPPIPPPPGVDPAPAQFAVAPDTPLNSLQKAIITASIRQHRGAAPGDPSIRRGVYEQVKTHGGAGAK